MQRFIILTARLLLLLLAIGLLVLSVKYMIEGFNVGEDDIRSGPITIGTILFIFSVVAFQFCNPDFYNQFNDGAKLVINTRKLTLRQIFDAFGDMPTAWGSPWMGRVQSIKGKVIILGPNPDGEYVFIRDLFGLFISINLGNITGFIKPDAKNEWRLEPVKKPDSLEGMIRYSFNTACLMDALAERIQTYLKTGTADTSEIGLNRDDAIYLFNEEFKWTGQDFHLLDVDMIPRLRVSSQIPCKTFHISDAKSGEELIVLTKRLFHIFTTYDVYQGKTIFCRLKRRLVLHHTAFSGQTSFGKLELIRMNAMAGSNYQVKLGGEQIGTIARKLNFTLDNVVFDNFILSIADPDWLPLMAAMGVMVARQAKREKTSTLANNLDDDDEL
ncbi:hypothetical protein [uncultured Cohaesibacter sp.]|uniref:hypothetical protein n=1 Tax=uncultured Cohaesibacter sp. TaxID=1002546 RepID=UPI00292ECC3E|nr:hypothetical protein [uncultured Cohaesibacter sp.]